MTTTTPSAISRLTDRGTNIGLLVLRIVLGVTFLAHGAQKFFVFTIPGTQASFADMGVPLPEVAAIVVATLELVGGAFLILGLATRIVGVMLAVDMAVALFLVHLSSGFFAADGGVELVLLLAVGALVLALTGPGVYALDTFVRRRIAPTS
ncbi:DoxX family protein [Plantibacter sp. Mn2098]|uniref:DoxX family protein n=1 Tax=Plantibacter sp. Mn2098 TaxID=3395266 RepID=UPI003BD6A611